MGGCLYPAISQAARQKLFQRGQTIGGAVIRQVGLPIARQLAQTAAYVWLGHPGFRQPTATRLQKTAICTKRLAGHPERVNLGVKARSGLGQGKRRQMPCHIKTRAASCLDHPLGHEALIGVYDRRFRYLHPVRQARIDESLTPGAA